MALTDENLVIERANYIGGVQRTYELGPDGHLDYTTPLTSDVEVFDTDEEANAFIEKAFAWFRLQADVERDGA